MWYIKLQMGSFRKSLPWLSLLLLAVFVPAQAAGCCKWSAWLERILPAEKVAASAQVPAGGMAPGHACCRKQAPPEAVPEPAPASPDCATGDKGCCLKDARAMEPALVSVPVPFTDGTFALLLLPSGETPRIVPLPPSHTFPETSGPPAYLAQRRLLI